MCGFLFIPKRFGNGTNLTLLAASDKKDGQKMRTIRIKLYKFEELTKDAQQKAIELLRDINVDYNWWEGIYEDAEQAGLKVEGFDLYRNEIDLKFVSDANEIKNYILENHGNVCASHKAAKEYETEQKELVCRYSNGIDKDIVIQDNWDAYDGEIEEKEKSFRYRLAKYYLNMLEKEYEYATTEEAIKETIESNDYDFTKDGKLY